MLPFIKEIILDIDWRIGELAAIKSIPSKYSFSSSHKEIHYKYSVPGIYSIWEGYVKNTLTTYCRYLNTLGLLSSNISINLLTHYLDSLCKLNNPRYNFSSKLRMVTEIDLSYSSTISLIPEIPTESNVNYKVISSILDRFCIEKLDGKYEKGLDKLLLFRNKIAHGENALKVTDIHINEFIQLVENLMLDMIINIEQSEIRKSYIRT